MIGPNVGPNALGSRLGIPIGVCCEGCDIAKPKPSMPFANVLGETVISTGEGGTLTGRLEAISMM